MIDFLNCVLVSEHMIGEIKPEHSKGDCQFRDLSYFKYACVGYSIYLDDKETSVGVHEKKADEQLPVCFGAEVIYSNHSNRNLIRNMILVMRNFGMVGWLFVPICLSS